jgi:NADH:ubiquinone oxidoreductase subunit E/Na+-transporting methylmalonyl-CoA/oxaloacetate decarboxylase gamma subunit
MTSGEQLKLARRVGVASALVALVSVGGLVADHVVAVRRAPAEKSRVQALEEQVKTAPVIAAILHEERKQQTASSLARRSRGRALAWVLLVSGGLVVVSGKWYLSLRPAPVPTLEALVAVRFQAPKAAEGRARKADSHSDTGADPGLDLSFVDALVERFGRSREAAIPILQAIQSHYRYLPDEALRRVCEQTDITPAQIAGSSSFYAQFRRSPVGRHVVRVCHGTACHVAGAEQISQELRRHLAIPPEGDTDPRRLFTLDAVACLGCCSLAPVMMIEDETAGRLTPASARQAIDAVRT